MTRTPVIKVSFKAQMLQAREDAIIEVVNHLLAEKGFEAMTVDEVAAQVGIAKASLYKHFPSKEDLAAAAMAHLMSKALAFVEAMPPEQSALNKLRVLGKEGLNLPGTSHSQPRYSHPPAPPARYAHSQVGQGVDAMGFQGPHRALRQPQTDIVGDLRRWWGNGAQQFNRGNSGAAVRDTIRFRMLKGTGKILASTKPCKGRQFPADVPYLRS